MTLVLTTYRLTTKLPADERFGLCAQVRRAAVSVPSNVAEGQANGPGKRYIHPVRIAIGSLAELEKQKEVIQQLKLVAATDLVEVQQQIERERQLLYGLKRSLRRQLAAGHPTRVDD